MAKILEDIKGSFNKGNSMVRKLILINIAVFLVINGIKLVAYLFLENASYADSINHWVYMPANPSKFIWQPWSIFTYMFVHEGLWHIFFNLLWLYYLGSLFQEYLGNKKVLRAYIYGGILGGIIYMLGMNIFPVLRESFYYPFPLHGASAGVMAVIVGIATLLPNYEIRLIFFDVKLKYIAVFMVASSFINMYSSNPGGNLAHVGGALAGYLYIRYLSKHTLLDRIEEHIVGLWKRLFGKGSKKLQGHKTYTTHMRTEHTRKPNQEEIDEILDKISKSGYDSLTRPEREVLFKASKSDS